MRRLASQLNAMSPENSIIYVIQAGKDGPVKIGATSGNPRRRLESLQTGNSEELTILMTFPGDTQKEAEFHRKLAGYKMRGEWFSPDVIPKLPAHLSTYCDAPDDTRKLPSGNKLRDWLRDKKKKEGSFAKELGISHSALSRMLNTRRKPTLRLAVKIEEATGGAVVLRDWLVTSEKDCVQAVA